ncbi:hypothetical protein [Haladaptatus sp. NG-SE-30]
MAVGDGAGSRGQGRIVAVACESARRAVSVTGRSWRRAREGFAMRAGTAGRSKGVRMFGAAGRMGTRWTRRGNAWGMR